MRAALGKNHRTEKLTGKTTEILRRRRERETIFLLERGSTLCPLIVTRIITFGTSELSKLFVLQKTFFYRTHFPPPVFVNFNLKGISSVIILENNLQR